MSERPPSRTNVAADIDGASRTLEMELLASKLLLSGYQAKHSSTCDLKQWFLASMRQKFKYLKEPVEENEDRLAEQKAEHNRRKLRRQRYRDFVGAYKFEYEAPDPISPDDDDLARHRKKTAELLGDDLYGRRDWDRLDFEMLAKLMNRKTEALGNDVPEWVRDLIQRVEKFLDMDQDTGGITTTEKRDHRLTDEKAAKIRIMLRRFFGEDVVGERVVKKPQQKGKDPEKLPEQKKKEPEKLPEQKKKGPKKQPEQQKEHGKLPERKKKETEKQLNKANGTKLSAEKSRCVLESNGGIEPVHGSGSQKANTAADVAGSSSSAPPLPPTTTPQPLGGNRKPPKSSKAADSVAGPTGQQGNTAATVAAGPLSGETPQPPIKRGRGRPRKVAGAPKSTYNCKNRRRSQEDDGGPAKKKAKCSNSPNQEGERSTPKTRTGLGPYQPSENDAAPDTVLSSGLSDTSTQHQHSPYFEGGRYSDQTGTMPSQVSVLPAMSIQYQALVPAQDQERRQGLGLGQAQTQHQHQYPGHASNQVGHPIVREGIMPPSVKRLRGNTRREAQHQEQAPHPDRANNQGQANYQGWQPITQGGFVPSPPERVMLNMMRQAQHQGQAQRQWEAQNQGWTNYQTGQPITQGGSVQPPTNRVLVNTMGLPRPEFSPHPQSPVNYAGAFPNMASDLCLPDDDDDKMV